MTDRDWFLVRPFRPINNQSQATSTTTTCSCTRGRVRATRTRTHPAPPGEIHRLSHLLRAHLRLRPRLRRCAP